MKLPIVAIGDGVLRKKCKEIDKNYPELVEFIANMKETMKGASGVGLAAPQVNKDIRIFLVDSTIMLEDEETDEVGIIETFINAKILEESGEEWAFEEGCLSIPEIRENVTRKSIVKIEYYDEKWKKHSKTYDGITARIIQHEYDHIEGILFTDHLKPLKKRMLKKRLNKISEGKINPGYKMKFPRK